MADFTKLEQRAPDRVPTERDFQKAAKLREAIRLFLRESKRITRRWGLTLERYELLLMVRTARDRSGRASLAELMERLQLAQSSVVELVDRAERLGLVARERGSGRTVYVGLTDEGRRRLEGAAAALTQHRRRLVSILSNLG
jgi:DNA-binding MarR family transcriptional regulator